MSGGNTETLKDLKHFSQNYNLQNFVSDGSMYGQAPRASINKGDWDSWLDSRESP